MIENKIIIINLISLKTIINKEVIRILRIWPQTILPQIVTTSLYFLIFGNLIGKRIGHMSSYTYIEYIIPGLIMMAIITSSYSNVVSSFFGSKFQKNIEEILISPTYNITIIIGFASGGIIRSFIIYILILITSSIFSNIHFYNIIIFTLAYITTSILFSFLGLINGIFAKKFDDISIIPTFILTPLIYLGGIFYSIDILPENLKIYVYINPIFYINNTFRYGVLGISEINIFTAFSIMIALIITILTVSIYLLNKGHEIKK
ncbi:MAG TPA: ABC transporter permease [Candidatus Azoamicus sp.]